MAASRKFEPIFLRNSFWDSRFPSSLSWPIETDAGWLVLTHDVGPMRRYTLSALLLDLADPWRVIGCLPVPLLAPDASEGEGDAPHVLYSCGGLINGDTLVLPYGFSDHGIHIALIAVPDLLAELTNSPTISRQTDR